MWQISRISNVTPISRGQIPDKDNLNDTKIPGRIILDVWRIMRHEIGKLYILKVKHILKDYMYIL